MKLSEKLKALRQKSGLSQERVAELIGVSRQSVSKWETGLSNPDTDNLIRLAKIYQVSLDEFMNAAEHTQQLPDNDFRPHIPRFVLLSYIVSFGAITGFFCPPVSNVPTPYLLWICMGSIGGIMIALKNRKILIKANSLKVHLMDTGVLFLIILSGWMLPNSLGMMKALILAIPAGIYTVWVCQKFFLVKVLQE